MHSKLFIAMLLLSKQIMFDLVASMQYFPSAVYHVDYVGERISLAVSDSIST